MIFITPKKDLQHMHAGIIKSYRLTTDRFNSLNDTQSYFHEYDWLCHIYTLL